jgi:hypothetical protein
MRSTRTTRAALAITALATTSILITGCGAVAEKAGEKAAEKAIESQGGGNVDIDTSEDGKVSIETEDGSVSFGSGEVPAEWPGDVPLPDDLEVSTGSTIGASDGRLVSVVGTSGQDPAELLEFFKDALSDWEISGESSTTSTSGGMTSAQWDTEGRRFTFVATTAMGDGTTMTAGHTTLD